MCLGAARGCKLTELARIERQRFSVAVTHSRYFPEKEDVVTCWDLRF